METMQSIVNQLYKNWECIIVDDGSTDNTITITKSFIETDSRFLFFERPKHLTKGASACRNFGVSKAKGTHIQFFDSDDIMHPNHLNSKMAVIKNNDLVVCKLQPFSGDFDNILFYEKDQLPDIKITDNLFENFTTGSFPMMMVAPLWKANTIKRYLPIREDLHILEDHELHARALFETKKVAVINQPLIYYRVGEDSSTNNFYRNVSYGLNSYFEAKKTVLHLSKSKNIKLAILKMTLGFFRQALAERNFDAANKCLEFIKKQKLCYNFKLKLKCSRIWFFYSIFKIIKKGDTRFKPLFKL